MDWSSIIATVISVGTLALISAYKFGKLEQQVKDINERVKGIARIVGSLNPQDKEVNE